MPAQSPPPARPEVYRASMAFYRQFFNGRRFNLDDLPSYHRSGHFADVERYTRVLELVDGLNLPPQTCALDLGAGGGLLSAALAQRFEQVHSSDLDETPDMALTRQGIPRLSFAAGALPYLPYPAARFDLVVFSEVLEHLLRADQPRAFAEIARVLLPGGYCVVSTPNPDGIYPRLRRLTQRLKTAFGLAVDNDNQLLENWLSVAQVNAMVQRHFTIERRAGSFYVPPGIDRLPDWLAKGLYRLSQAANRWPALHSLGLYQFYVLRK